MGHFKLAPMHPAFRVLTGLLLPLPVVLAAVAALVPSPESTILFATSVFVGLVYVFVWKYMRPSGFEVDTLGLVVVWPWRRRVLSARNIASARIIQKSDFWSEFGFPLRVGAGGLWGGFGLLWTHRRGWINFYITRSNDMVVVERAGQGPLLITPERPEEFLAQLRGIVGH
jgi:hypothetical protein